MTEQTNTPAKPRHESDDPFFDDAMTLGYRFNYVTISMLQRHLGIGYTRASRIVDDMIRAGHCKEVAGTTMRPMTNVPKPSRPVPADATD